MQFRHEVKYEITPFDLLILRQRLRAVMKPDPYAVDGRYEIRSLYFDDPNDKALREKQDGVPIREKYRIRIYNRDTSVIHLERKFKRGALGLKTSANLTREQTDRIIRGDFEWMSLEKNETILGLFTRIRTEGLRAKVIVDYIREPFVYPAGNVRVTLDHDIRTGMRCTDLLREDPLTVPVDGSPCILEVKWDNYLPDIIRDAVQLSSRHSASYSKYEAGRMYD